MEIGLIAAAFALGGVLKGAIGVGAPLLAVPLIAIHYGVPFAVAIFVVPNIVSNAWQAWTYRRQNLPGRFVWTYAPAGGLGAGIGTVLLANLPASVLSTMAAAVVFSYVAFRLLRPGWQLAYSRAAPLAFPLGMLAGLLQGASGLSAPASMTFLNAMRLERGQFIFAISSLFVAMGLVQFPLLTGYGILTPEKMLYGGLALLPLALGMPAGAFLVRHVSRDTFDKLVLLLLFILALKLLFDAFF